MKPLTRAEEAVMQNLWSLKKAFLREIVEAMPEPRPHQNTVATVLKILIDKGYVAVEPFGRMHQYYPLIQKEDYSGKRIQTLAKKYFGGSFTSVVSAMVKEKSLSVEELEMLVNELKKNKK